MPWCPNCKTEYRDGFTTCTDCGSDLCEEYPESPNEEAPPGQTGYPVLLTEANDSIEADMLAAMLESEGIRAMKKYKDAGGYMKLYMGTTVFGVDVYVASGDFERAKEIIEGYFANSGSFPCGGENTPEASGASQSVDNPLASTKYKGGMDFGERRNIFRIILLAMLIPGLLVFLIMGITQIWALFSLW